MPHSPEQLRLWRIERLRESLQALAAPAEAQIARFPEFVVVTDELALDWGNFYDACTGNRDLDFTDEQLAALAAVDGKLDEMSDSKQGWEMEDLRGGEHWVEVRRLAAEGLRAMGWAADDPGPSPDQYVGRA